jgi:hypothetical protein
MLAAALWTVAVVTLLIVAASVNWREARRRRRVARIAARVAW